MGSFFQCLTITSGSIVECKTASFWIRRVPLTHGEDAKSTFGHRAPPSQSDAALERVPVIARQRSLIGLSAVIGETVGALGSRLRPGLGSCPIGMHLSSTCVTEVER